MSIDVEFLKQITECFNARDMEAGLGALDSDVTWANGMEGVYFTAVRRCGVLDPNRQPSTRTSSRLAFSTRADGETIVQAHQTVPTSRVAALVDQMASGTSSRSRMP